MRKTVYTAIFLTAFAVYLVTSLNQGTLNAPPELGDGQDYDAIAFNIAHHRGFGFDWDDPDWRRPYLQFQMYQGVLTRHSDYYCFSLPSGLLSTENRAKPGLSFSS